MIRVAVQQRDAEPAIGRVDEERPQSQGRGFGQVFVRIAEPAMELQRDVELLTFLRGLEEHRMTEAVACQPYGLATLRSQTQRTEGGTQRVGIDGLEFEAGAVGADRFHADGASVNPLPQLRSRCR